MSDFKHCYHPTNPQATVWENKHYVDSHLRIASHMTQTNGDNLYSAFMVFTGFSSGTPLNKFLLSLEFVILVLCT